METVGDTIILADQSKSLTRRQQKAWLEADRKAKTLMKDVAPAVARKHIHNLVGKGVKTSEAYERTALSWQMIEEGMEAKKKRKKN